MSMEDLEPIRVGVNVSARGRSRVLWTTLGPGARERFRFAKIVRRCNLLRRFDDLLFRNGLNTDADLVQPTAPALPEPRPLLPRYLRTTVHTLAPPTGRTLVACLAAPG